MPTGCWRPPGTSARVIEAKVVMAIAREGLTHKIAVSPPPLITSVEAMPCAGWPLHPSPRVRDLLAALVELERGLDQQLSELADEEPDIREPLASRCLTLSRDTAQQVERLAGSPLPDDLLCLLAAREADLLAAWLFPPADLVERTRQAHREGLHQGRIYLGQFRRQGLVFDPASGFIVEVDARWRRQRRMTTDELLSDYLDALLTSPTSLLFPGTARDAREAGSGIALNMRLS
jgi:hypothetical protein